MSKKSLALTIEDIDSPSPEDSVPQPVFGSFSESSSFLSSVDKDEGGNKKKKGFSRFGRSSSIVNFINKDKISQSEGPKKKSSGLVPCEPTTLVTSVPDEVTQSQIKAGKFASADGGRNSKLAFPSGSFQPRPHSSSSSAPIGFATATAGANSEAPGAVWVKTPKITITSKMTGFLFSRNKFAETDGSGDSDRIQSARYERDDTRVVNPLFGKNFAANQSSGSSSSSSSRDSNIPSITGSTKPRKSTLPNEVLKASSVTAGEPPSPSRETKPDAGKENSFVVTTSTAAASSSPTSKKLTATSIGRKEFSSDVFASIKLLEVAKQSGRSRLLSTFLESGDVTLLNQPNSGQINIPVSIDDGQSLFQPVLFQIEKLDNYSSLSLASQLPSSPRSLFPSSNEQATNQLVGIVFESADIDALKKAVDMALKIQKLWNNLLQQNTTGCFLSISSSNRVSPARSLCLIATKFDVLSCDPSAMAESYHRCWDAAVHLQAPVFFTSSKLGVNVKECFMWLLSHHAIVQLQQLPPTVLVERLSVSTTPSNLVLSQSQLFHPQFLPLESISQQTEKRTPLQLPHSFFTPTRHSLICIRLRKSPLLSPVIAKRKTEAIKGSVEQLHLPGEDFCSFYVTLFQNSFLLFNRFLATNSREEKVNTEPEPLQSSLFPSPSYAALFSASRRASAPALDDNQAKPSSQIVLSPRVHQETLLLHLGDFCVRKMEEVVGPAFFGCTLSLHDSTFSLDLLWNDESKAADWLSALDLLCAASLQPTSADAGRAITNRSRMLQLIGNNSKQQVSPDPNKRIQTEAVLFRTREAFERHLHEAASSFACADCDKPSVDYLSTQFGVFLCDSCSSIHEIALGPGISRIIAVKTLASSAKIWFPLNLLPSDTEEGSTNQRMNSLLWESNASSFPDFSQIKPDRQAAISTKEKFIFKKYQKLQFYQPFQANVKVKIDKKWERRSIFLSSSGTLFICEPSLDLKTTPSFAGSFGNGSISSATGHDVMNWLHRIPLISTPISIQMQDGTVALGDPHDSTSFASGSALSTASLLPSGHEGTFVFCLNLTNSKSSFLFKVNSASLGKKIIQLLYWAASPLRGCSQVENEVPNEVTSQVNDDLSYHYLDAISKKAGGFVSVNSSGGGSRSRSGSGSGSSWQKVLELLHQRQQQRLIDSKLKEQLRLRAFLQEKLSELSLSIKATQTMQSQSAQDLKRTESNYSLPLTPSAEYTLALVHPLATLFSIGNSDGTIKAAIFPLLCSSLLIDSYINFIDPKYLETFFLMLPTFSPLGEFLRTLSLWFNDPALVPFIPPLGSQRMSTPHSVRLAIFSILKWWIENSWDSFSSDEEFVCQFLILIDTGLSIPGFQKKAEKIHLLVLKNLSEANLLVDGEAVDGSVTNPIGLSMLTSASPISLHATQNSAALPQISNGLASSKDSLSSSTSGDGSKIDHLTSAFLDTDPVELARQICLIFHSLLVKIKPQELLNKNWTSNSKQRLAPNICIFISKFNNLSEVVSSSVFLTSANKSKRKQRAKIVEKWILTAQKCKEFLNFAAVVSILGGLQNPTILRLKRTWESVPSKSMAAMVELQQLCLIDDNWANYRAVIATRSIAAPTVPYLGVNLKDILFVEDGVSEFLPLVSHEGPSMVLSQSLNSPGNELQPPVRLINFSKKRKCADLIRDLQSYQRHPYGFKKIATIETMLLFIPTLNEADLYSLSKTLEPNK